MFQVKDNAIGNIKYVGISSAVVVDNNDPLKRGRIRVNSPVLGETNWIPYLTTPGTFNVPDIDTVVFLQCDGGFYTHPVAWGNLNHGDDDDLQFPEEFQRVSPTNRGFYTPGGHLIEIDDGTDETGTSRGIRITTTDKTIINIADEELDHSVTVTFDDGLEIIADGTNDKFTVDTNNGEHLEISKAEGIQLSTPDDGGTSASFKGGKIDILADGDVTITSSTGTFTLETDGDLAIVSSSGDITLSDGNGNEVAMTSDGIKATDSSGGELNISSGKVALGNSIAELVDLVSQLTDKVTEICTDLSTTTAAGFGAPISSVALFGTLAGTDIPAIATKLAQIKGSL